VEMGPPDGPERVGEAVGVAQLTEVRCRFFGEAELRVDSADPRREAPGRRQRSRPDGHGLVRRGQGEELFEPPKSLVDVADNPPEVLERGGEPQADLRLARAYRPAERCADVVVVPLEPARPRRLLATREPLGGALGDADPVLGVAASHERLFAVGGEPLQPVFPDRLEDPEARRPVIRLHGAHEMALDQRCHPVERVEAELAVAVDDGVDRLEVRAARKHGEPREHPSFRRREQVVAPVDRPAHRPLALRHVAIGGGQQGEPPLEAREQLRGREERDAAGRELDRER
jgi:hypothetical protein